MKPETLTLSSLRIYGASFSKTYVHFLSHFGPQCINILIGVRSSANPTIALFSNPLWVKSSCSRCGVSSFSIYRLVSSGSSHAETKGIFDVKLTGRLFKHPWRRSCNLVGACTLLLLCFFFRRLRRYFAESLVRSQAASFTARSSAIPRSTQSSAFVGVSFPPISFISTVLPHKQGFDYYFRARVCAYAITRANYN